MSEQVTAAPLRCRARGCSNTRRSRRHKWCDSCREKVRAKQQLLGQKRWHTRKKKGLQPAVKHRFVWRLGELTRWAKANPQHANLLAAIRKQPLPGKAL